MAGKSVTADNIMLRMEMEMNEANRKLMNWLSDQ